MRKSLITIGSALKIPKLGIMCLEQFFNNLFVGINGMSLKIFFVKVYNIMLTPKTGLYKTSKGYESICNFIVIEGELKRITLGDCSDSINKSSPKIKTNSLVISLRNFKLSGCDKLGLKSLDYRG